METNSSHKDVHPFWQQPKYGPWRMAFQPQVIFITVTCAAWRHPVGWQGRGFCAEKRRCLLKSAARTTELCDIWGWIHTSEGHGCALSTLEGHCLLFLAQGQGRCLFWLSLDRNGWVWFLFPICPWLNNFPKLQLGKWNQRLKPAVSPSSFILSHSNFCHGNPIRGSKRSWALGPNREVDKSLHGGFGTQPKTMQMFACMCVCVGVFCVCVLCVPMAAGGGLPGTNGHYLAQPNVHVRVRRRPRESVGQLGGEGGPGFAAVMRAIPKLPRKIVGIPGSVSVWCIQGVLLWSPAGSGVRCLRLLLTPSDMRPHHLSFVALACRQGPWQRGSSSAPSEG